MKKIVNVRLPVIICCALAVGIALNCLFIKNNISLIWIAAVIPLTAVIIILCTLLRKSGKLSVCILLTALFFIAGSLNCFIRLNSYTNSQLIDGNVYSLSATVCEKGKTARGEYIIVNNAKAGGDKISGKIIVYLSSNYGELCDVGYKVNFTAEIKKYDLFPYGKLNYNAPSNVKFYCFVTGGLTAKYGFSLFGSIRTAIRNILFEKLDGETAAIAYAMITGNTQDVESETMQSFRYGGIAHIFAVSGLHTGIVYGVLYYILNKLKLNKRLVAALCILTVFFYAGICGLTLSSLRAAIMCATSTFTRLAYKKYDGLNALAISVILILLVNPLNLYLAGFQLSVCAVGGIIILSHNFVKPLKRLPKKVSNALAISLSAQAGTMPVMLLHFGYISGAGLLLNVLIIPLMSALYILLLACIIICAILPFATFLMQYVAVPLQLVTAFFTNTGFENALISGFGAGAFLPLYYIFIFAFSDKINLKLLQRITAVICAFTVLCSYTVIKIFSPFNGVDIIVSAYYDGGAVLIKSKDGNVLVLTEGFSAQRARSLLAEYYANKLSVVVVVGGENCFDVLNGFDIEFESAYIYVGNINFQPYENFEITYAESFSAGGIDYKFADGYSLLVRCGNKSVAVCAGDNIPFESCDLLISDSKKDCLCEYRAGFNARYEKYNAYDCGNITFKIRNDRIEIN